MAHGTDQLDLGREALVSEPRAAHARLIAAMALAAVGGFCGMLLLMGGTMEREPEALEDGWGAAAALGTAQPASPRFAADRSSKRASRVPTYIRIGGPEPQPDPVALALKTLRGRM